MSDDLESLSGEAAFDNEFMRLLAESDKEHLTLSDTGYITSASIASQWLSNIFNSDSPEPIPSPYKGEVRRVPDYSINLNLNSGTLEIRITADGIECYRDNCRFGFFPKMKDGECLVIETPDAHEFQLIKRQSVYELFSVAHA